MENTQDFSLTSVCNIFTTFKYICIYKCRTVKCVSTLLTQLSIISLYHTLRGRGLNTVISVGKGRDTLSSRDMRIVCPRPNTSNTQCLSQPPKGRQTRHLQCTSSFVEHSSMLLSGCLSTTYTPMLLCPWTTSWLLLYIL